MKKLHLKVFVLFVITLNFSVSFSQNVNPIKDYKSTFNPKVCDKLSRFLKENNTAMLLCVNFLKDDNLSIAKADLILRNSLGLHPLYAFESFTYLYTINGRKDMYYSLQKYLAPNELSNVDKCIVFAIKELGKDNKIKEAKRNEEIKENNDRIKRAEQDAINYVNNVLRVDVNSKKIVEDYIVVDLNDYGRIVYSNDSTDWNATELDERMDSVLKANNVFYKDNIGWVKQKNKEEPISNRVLLTKKIEPVFNKDIEGEITVNLRVNETGDVIQVNIGSPTNISDKEMRDNALNAAKKLKFNQANTVSSGYITYNFKLSSGNENNELNDKKDKNDKNTPSPKILIMPIYPGGDSELHVFISKNLKYPKAAKRDKVEGKVRLAFNVNDKGSVDDVKVIRSLSPECDEEAIRVVKLLVFSPAIDEYGHKASVNYSLYIEFKTN